MKENICVKELDITKLYGRKNCNIYFVKCIGSMASILYEASARHIHLYPITMLDYIEFKRKGMGE